MERRTFMKGALLAASMPAAIGTVALFGIDGAYLRFNQANKAWLNCRNGSGDDIEAAGPEYEAAWKACKDLVTMPCSSPEEVSRKIDIVVSDSWLQECAETGFDEEKGYLFRHFLNSLKV